MGSFFPPFSSTIGDVFGVGGWAQSGCAAVPSGFAMGWGESAGGCQTWGDDCLQEPRGVSREGGPEPIEVWPLTEQGPALVLFLIQ